ncbi:hypothetical protein ABWJ92_33835 [Streptomyces sp. NPDC000609]|uniref:hypothetical protein n=1 Tax=Streptomyces sp. NPDC000609 TaxID=3160957 RepID=UPI00339A809B
MTSSRPRTNTPHRDEPPLSQKLLRETDWASLGTPTGTGEALPAALERLLATDPDVRATAVREALGAVTHQNTVYEVTVPVALYVAAILDHPATAMGGFDQSGERAPHYSTRVALLNWLSDTAHDADDETVTIAERVCGNTFLDECPEIRAFRDLRPTICSAVRQHLGHDNAEVRDAALLAAIPLAEHPALAALRDELAGHARRLPATNTDRHTRDRVLDALHAWGHNTRGLENADDIAARDPRVRQVTARGSWAGGGHSAAPPF